MTPSARTLRRASAVAALIAGAVLAVPGIASAATITKLVPSAGTIAVPSVAAPTASTSDLPEIDSATAGDQDGLDPGSPIARTPSLGRRGTNGRAPSATLATGWEGLNFFDQRFANGGNQFSVEPPDQGLCVGNGKVVEVVNSVYQVFDTSGAALTNPIDLNTLFGYPAAINRTTGAVGPDVFDPVCLYDQPTNTFYVVVSVLDRVGTTSALSGSSHVDILAGSDPTGTFTKYSIDTTRDYPCFNDEARKEPGPCFPDYPHIGADRNGLYITTNVFDFIGPFFDTVNIYAIPKSALASGGFSIPVTITNTDGLSQDGTGFTLIPAMTPGNQFDGSNGGTESFVSSRAVFTDDGTATTLEVWKLANTGSLNTGSPSLSLTEADVPVSEYGIPALARQKEGAAPLAQCLGTEGCWQLVNSTFHFNQAKTLGVQKLAADDTRVGGVAYANGKLWATLGTSATDSKGAAADGVAWYVINAAGPGASLINEGLVVKDGTDLTYPSIGVTQNGRGVLGFTITGPSDFPSAGFAGLDAKTGAGAVQYAAAGAGPQDGFTEYLAVGTNAWRPRWGDYGAASASGNSVWVASEYIAQTCTLAAYTASPFGTCGSTRGSIGNWSTRISQVTP